MMNSTAGEDGDFPPNPFRAAGQQQDDFFSTAAPPPVQTAAPMYAQQQFPPQQQQQFPPQQQQQQQQPVYAQQQQPAPVQYTTPAPAPYTTPAPVPSGQMNTNNVNMQQQPGQMTRYEACMSCFRIETYLAYFDVDTQDIVDRLKGAVFYFYHPDKFRCEVIGAARSETLKGPDLYGPLWITMTLVFFLGVTSNLSAYIRADNLKEFEYDISHLVHAMTVCFGFAFGVPALWWLTTQCMGMQALMMVDWICLYGYSMVPYLPATIMCLIPWHPWMWLCLMAATGASGLLVVRNVAAPLLGADTQGNKSGPLLIAILASHFIFLLVLKLYFYE